MEEINPEYRKAIEKINADGEEFANQQMQTVYKNQKEHLDELHTFLGLLYIKYAVDGLLNLSTIVKASVMTQIDSKLKAIGKDLGQTEVDKVTDILSRSYSDVYYKNAFVMDKSFGVNLKFNILNDKLVNTAVNTKLNGELFSDRIWQNKADMLGKLHKALTNITKGDTTIDKAGKMIQETFNVSAYESKRLVTTELTRIQSQAQSDIAENVGIKKQMWSATLDVHTCNRCTALDGKIFDINDPERPMPPLHPLDRCCWINVPYDDWQPTRRMDNETKKIIDYENYDDWYNKNVNNSENNNVNTKNNGIISNNKWLSSSFSTEKNLTNTLQNT